MATAKIVFDLSDSEDLREYNLFNNAGGMFNALFEISYNLKKKISYQLQEDETLDALDLTFEKIAQILEENNVILDKLT